MLRGAVPRLLLSVGNLLVRSTDDVKGGSGSQTGKWNSLGDEID